MSMRFFLRAALALLPAAGLVACGGDDDAPATPDDAMAWAAQCGASPDVTPDQAYLGATPDGQVGTWTFDTAALSSTHDIGGSQGTTTLRRDASSCTYLGVDTGALRTAFLANGVAISSAVVAGQPEPALLVNGLQSSPAAVAGAYRLVRFMRVTQPSSAQAVAGYGVFTLDAQGGWSLCFDAEPGPSCTPYTGSAAARPDGSFDVVMDGQVHARMLVKQSGDSKLLVVAIDNPFDPSAKISGLWVGVDAASAPDLATSRRYVVNGTDQAAHFDAFSADGLSVDGAAPQAWAVDVPQPGYFSAGGAFGIVSPLGVVAAASQPPTGDAIVTFGVQAAQ